MSPRICRPAFLLILCIAAAGSVAHAQEASPNPAQQPHSKSLTGIWLDVRHHRTFRIEQTGDQVVLSTQTGVLFAGKISGQSIDLEHKLTFEETNKRLPLAVRRKIVGELVEFAGSISKDGNTIQGEFHNPRPQWVRSPDTGEYVITATQDVRVPFLLTRMRGEIHIDRIQVDYKAASQRMMDIRDKLYQLNLELQAGMPLLAEAEQRYRAADARAEETSHALLAARIWLAYAQPSPKLSLQIQYLQAMLDYKQLAQAHAPDMQLNDALNRMDALARKVRAKGLHPPPETRLTISQVQRMIHNLQQRKRAAQAALTGKENAYWEARRADVHAESDLDLALQTLEFEKAQELPLLVKRQHLESLTKNGLEKGDPLLTAVEITDSTGLVYQAHWRDPKAVLDELNEAIHELDAQIGEDSKNATTLHTDYQEAVREELDAFGRVPSAIWESAFAQYGVEVGDFAQEIVRKTIESDDPLAGVLEAVGEKYLEIGQEIAWAKGSFKEVGDYKFVDEAKIRKDVDKAKIRQYMDDANIREEMMRELHLQGGERGEEAETEEKVKEMKETGKLIGKTLINDASTKLLTRKLGPPGFRDLMKFLRKQSNLAEEVLQIEGMHAAGKSLREAFGEVFKKSARKGIKGFAVDAGKEYLKDEAKKKLSNHIEGEAWRDAFETQFNRILLHHQWAAARIRVRGMNRIRARYQFARDEVLREYVNNEAHYEALESRPLMPDHDYTARLTFSGAQPTKVEVRLGDRPAQGTKETFTLHTGPSKGKFTLFVKVVEY